MSSPSFPFRFHGGAVASRIRRPVPLLAFCALLAGGIAPASAATTIIPVPVKPNASAPYTIAGSFLVRVEDAANSSIFANVDTHNHKVSYPNTVKPPAGTPGSDLVNNVYYSHFSFGGGSAKVKVTLSNFASNAPAGTFSVKLSPTSYGIATTIAGNVVSFTLTKSRYMMLKVSDTNNTYPFYLIVMADALETSVPPSSGSGIYNVVTQYGAASDFSTPAQGAIQNAINAANGAGGGIVYVPPGVYKIGTRITPKSNVSVYLAPGAYLRCDDYLDRAVVGSKVYIFDAPAGSNLTNFKIYGRGTLDANGIGAGGHRVSKDDVQANGVQTSPIRIDDGSNITFDGIVLREANAWTIHEDRDDNLTVTNTKVVNYVQDFALYRENDGIDLVQCTNSSVTHCFVFTADDAVCFKGDDGFDSIHNGGNNGVYYDLVVWSGADGCKFGGEARSPISNSYFRNIDIVQAQRAIAIHITGGSSLFNQIGFADVRCENATSRPIDFELLGSAVSADVTNASVVNFTCANFGTANSTIKGQSGATFNGVAFNNLTIAGSVRLSASAAQITTNSFATGITFANTSPDVNLVLDVSPSAMSSNWDTGANSLALINDALTTNEAKATNNSDAQVTFPVANKVITSARVYKDNGTYSAASWKLERKDVATQAWVTVFDFTACPIDGWNSGASFSSALTSAVRITFRAATGGFVGINEVEVYGH